MKNARFRSSESKNRNKIVLVILASSICVCLLCSRFSTVVSKRIKDYLVTRVKKENTLVLKDAFSYLLKDEVDMANLIKVVKNSKEEIVEVNFDIKESTKLLSNVTGYINHNLEEYNFLGYRLDVPFGVVSNSPLFMNLGPRIPVKVEIGDVALGNVKTKVREFGVNSALVELYLEVKIDMTVIYPFETIMENSIFESLISSKVIQGVVPSFYNGIINSKSDTISLPIAQ